MMPPQKSKHQKKRGKTAFSILFQEFLSQVPLLFMWLLSLRVAAHGAALTEKCRGIPPFVNQMPGELIDHQRQYLVRFVTEPWNTKFLGSCVDE